jgi:hypothetical protein
MKSTNFKLQKHLKISFLISYAVLLLGKPETLFAQAQERQFEPVYATVLEDQVNIRARQGLNFEVLGQLNQAAQVVVTGQGYGWYKIKLPKEALCFVHSDYINEGIVETDKLRVRAGCGTNFNVLGILRKGETVDIVEEKGDWVRIRPPKGCSGWIRKDYLKLSEKKFIPPPLRPSASLSPRAQARQGRIKTMGVIDDLGKIFNRQGTHKLIKDKKILYYLKSDGIDLGDYIYQKVCVIGCLTKPKNSPYPVINVEQIEARE